MEDMVVRPIYPRHTLPSKRRKRISKENSGLAMTFKRQLALCLVLLLIAAAIKEVNTPATKFLTEKVKLGLKQNIEIDGIVAKIYSYIDNLKNGKSPVQNKAGSKADLVPSSAETLIPENTEEGKLDYGGVIEENGNLDKESDKQADEGGNSSQILSNDDNVSNTKNKQDKTSSVIMPVSGVISSNFGERVHPIKGTEQFHKGIDIEANSGTPVKAALDGEVIEASKEATYGNFVEIKHQDGLITIYAHCSVLIAKRGQKVKQGDIIAKVGSTGDSTGPHLHFEIWKNGNPVDPLKFTKK